MALRLTRRREHALRALARSGDAGEPVYLAPYHYFVFVQHGWAEYFIDPSRILSDRIKLTKIGRLYADNLLSKEEER